MITPDYTVRVDLDREDTGSRIQTFYDEHWNEIRRFGEQIAQLFGTDIRVTYSGIDAETNRFRSEVFGHFRVANSGTFEPVPFEDQ